MIHGYLLINEELGVCSSIRQDTEYGGRIKYDLSPAVLRVCQKMYEEGMVVLYEKNAFILACLDNTRLFHNPSRNFSPLSRHQTWVDVFANKLRHSPLHRVKKWRLILSASSSTPGHARSSSACFGKICKLISHNAIKSLEILIIPEGIEHNPEEIFQPSIPPRTAAPLSKC
jgi:hypothetical protein